MPRKSTKKSTKKSSEASELPTRQTKGLSGADDSQNHQPRQPELLVKRSRSSKYEPWMCDTVIDVAEQGGHVAQMCQAIGIQSRDTFYRWLKENSAFSEAYEAAKLQSQAFYEHLLLAGACGKVKNFNFHALAMILNNKFPSDYKRNATGSSTEINIGSINSIETLDEKALDKKIAALQDKLKLVTGPVEGDDSE